MEWGILAVTVIFVVVGYIVLQGTRASMAWRRAASGGDVDVIRQILEDEIASWRSIKRPKDVAPDVWRGVQSVALVDVAADSAPAGARLGASGSCQVEREYRLLGGRWGGGAPRRGGGPLGGALPGGGARCRPARRPRRRRRRRGIRRPAGAAAAMSALRFLTAGESHGKALTVIMDGLPAGLPLTEEFIAADLRRRQGGYGRSKRQQIEEDHAEIVSGVRHGRTLGSPLSLLIANRVWEDWQEVMQVEPFEGDVKRVTRLRPGHADLAGTMKYGFDDVRA